MTDAAWKAAERRICQALGGRRRGATVIGVDGHGLSDCIDTEESTQIKRSKRGVPEGRWIEDTKHQAAREGKEWLLVVIKPNMRLEDAITVCRFGRYLNLKNRPPTPFDSDDWWTRLGT